MRDPPLRVDHPIGRAPEQRPEIKVYSFLHSLLVFKSKFFHNSQQKEC
jgi:hypothetical protein